eukprot:s1210_g5.t1
MPRWLLIFLFFILTRNVEILFRFEEHGDVYPKATGSSEKGEGKTGFLFAQARLCILHKAKLKDILVTLNSHHSRDVNYLNKIRTTMAENIPWRCRWCVRLNKAQALRCGGCDYKWHECLDPTYVHGGRTKSPRSVQAWDQSTWSKEYQQDSQGQASRRAQRRKPTPRQNRKKNQEEYAVPELDPPWNPKGHPSTPRIKDGEEAESQSEDRFHQLVNALKNQEGPLDPEVQKIVDDESTPPASSKNMHQAVSKVDKARNKLKAATKSRQNLQLSWSKYLEESIKRWKTFAADFAKQDSEAEQKVHQARTALQQARTQMDRIKERLAKQDEESLRATEVISDGELEEDDNKMETSEKIQAGIKTVLESLDAIRVRPDEDDAEATAKRQKTAADSNSSSGPGAPECFPWNHSIIQAKHFVSEWQASIAALDLSFEVGEIDHCQARQDFAPRGRAKHCKVRFTQKVDFFVGSEDDHRMAHWTHALCVPHHRASIFFAEREDLDSDITSLMAARGQIVAPIQEGLDDPADEFLMDRHDVAMQAHDDAPDIAPNDHAGETDDSSEASWSPPRHARPDWRTVQIFALRSRPINMRLDINDYEGLHHSIARELDLLPVIYIMYIKWQNHLKTFFEGM